MYKINKIRSDFPYIYSNNSIYLDNASSTQKPIYLINNQIDIYKNKYSSYNKGIYKTSINITNDVENSRKYIANFINANYKEIVFTKNFTEGINIISNSLCNNLIKKNDNIIISELEHDSNFIIWKLMSEKIGFEIRILPINKKRGILDLDKLKLIINKRTKLITITHISNVLGIINPVENIISISKEINKNILSIIDGSQSVSHIKIDVKKIDCDFFIFTGHKIYGPLGIGILYGKYNILNTINPLEYGSSIIKSIDIKNFKNTKFIEIPWRFESSSINFPSIIGLKKSIEYINKIDILKINKWEKKITEFSINELKKIKGLKIYGRENDSKISIISFNIKNIDSYDISLFLDKYNIYIRSGNICSNMIMNKYNIDSLCRISYAMYTDYNDIMLFIDVLKEFILRFK